jgi:hypothetical protein
LDLGKCGRQNIWMGALLCAACHLGSQITFPELSDSKYIKQNKTENLLNNDIKYFQTSSFITFQ